MSEENLILILVFVSVLFATWGIRNMMRGTEINTSSNLPFIFRLFGPGIFFFSAEGGAMMEIAFPSASEKIREELKKAALSLEIKDVYGAILFFLFGGGVLGAVTVMSVPLSPVLRVFIVLVFALIGGLYPRICIRKMGNKRLDEILQSLPFAIDLISSSMNAGLDFGSSVRYLISTGKDDILKREFRVFLNDVELGKTRTEALHDMQERIGAVEFSRFVSAISFGMDSGSSIIDIMHIQAEEMRRVKFTRAEQQAEKAPLKMILPIALFDFPSMFIIILVPIFLKMKSSGVLQMLGN